MKVCIDVKDSRSRIIRVNKKVVAIKRQYAQIRTLEVTTSLLFKLVNLRVEEDAIDNHTRTKVAS